MRFSIFGIYVILHLTFEQFPLGLEETLLLLVSFSFLTLLQLRKKQISSETVAYVSCFVFCVFTVPIKKKVLDF